MNIHEFLQSARNPHFLSLPSCDLLRCASTHSATTMDPLFPCPRRSSDDRTAAGDEFENDTGDLWMNDDSDDDDDDDMYDAVAAMLLQPISYDIPCAADQEEQRRPKKKRKYHGGTFLVDDVGSKVLPRSTLWYTNYVKFPRLDDSRFCDKFRQRFLMWMQMQSHTAQVR